MVIPEQTTVRTFLRKVIHGDENPAVIGEGP
jgi:hypothetical protein